MLKFINWFFSSTKKEITEEHVDFYQKILELEEKYDNLIKDVVRLEEENIETTNTLYQIMNSIDAVDVRIDILTAEKFLKEKND